MAGIVVSPREEVILLFHTEEPAQQYYRDGFDKRGIYWYSGEGVSGDMRWTHANTAIRDHVNLGKDLLLFERFQRTGGYWRLAGRLQFHSHRIEQRADKAGRLRQAIVFGLLAVPTEVAPRRTYDDTLGPYSPEFAGSTTVKTPERSVEAHWVHGRVVDAVARALIGLGYAPKKSQAVDLALAGPSGSMAVVFEAKTDTDPYSIYTAIGQLMYHSAHDTRVQKVMVVPPLSTAQTDRIGSLGIAVLTYDRRGNDVVFDSVALDRVLAEAADARASSHATVGVP